MILDTLNASFPPGWSVTHIVQTIPGIWSAYASDGECYVHHSGETIEEALANCTTAIRDGKFSSYIFEGVVERYASTIDRKANTTFTLTLADIGLAKPPPNLPRIGKLL